MLYRLRKLLAVSAVLAGLLACVQALAGVPAAADIAGLLAYALTLISEGSKWFDG